MWKKKNLNEGYQIHNFISSSGSGTVINYGSGSGSDFLTSYGSGSGSTTLVIRLGSGQCEQCRKSGSRVRIRSVPEPGRLHGPNRTKISVSGLEELNALSRFWKYVAFYIFKKLKFSFHLSFLLLAIQKFAFDPDPFHQKVRIRIKMPIERPESSSQVVNNLYRSYVPYRASIFGIKIKY